MKPGKPLPNSTLTDRQIAEALGVGPFRVMMNDAGEKKILMIKTLRSLIPSLDLMLAKAAVDGTKVEGVSIVRNVSYGRALEVLEAIEKAGGKASITTW